MDEQSFHGVLRGVLRGVVKHPERKKGRWPEIFTQELSTASKRNIQKLNKILWSVRFSALLFCSPLHAAWKKKLWTLYRRLGRLRRQGKMYTNEFST